MTRKGPNRRSRRALKVASRMEVMDAPATIAGSELAGNEDRNRLSRAVLAATCQAIMMPAVRAARRKTPAFDNSVLSVPKAVGAILYYPHGAGATILDFE